MRNLVGKQGGRGDAARLRKTVQGGEEGLYLAGTVNVIGGEKRT